MSDWLITLGYFLIYALLLAIPVSCVLYLIWAGVRRSDRERSRPEYLRSDVRFHAGWGLVLSLPLVVVGAGYSFGPEVHWSGQLLLVATLGCWTVAIVAMLGRRVPPPLTWLPLVVTSVTTVVVPAMSAEDISGYFATLAFLSLAGVGLAAWVLVSVNFALAVRQLTRLNASQRTPERVPAPSEGFVWPA